METQQQLTLDSTTASVPIWQSIREALRGSHQDFTSVSLNRAILLLAIPMVLEMVLESVFAGIDVSPHVVVEVDDLHQLPPLVRARIGTAVVPASVAQANPDLHAIQLVRPALERATAPEPE